MRYQTELNESGNYIVAPPDHTIQTHWKHKHETNLEVKVSKLRKLRRRKQIKIELNRSTHSRLTVQFVSVVAGPAVLDSVAAQLVGDAVSGAALKVVRRLAVQSHGRRPRP